MFYQRFEELCRKNGYTPSGVCLAIGRSKNLAAKWKSTNATPSAEVLNQLAVFFDVSVDYLLGNTNGTVEDEYAVRQEILDNVDMRVLFDAARGIPRSKLYETIAMLNKFKEDNGIDT